MTTLTESDKEKLAKFAGDETDSTQDSYLFGSYIDGCLCKKSDWLNPNNPEAFTYQVHAILLPKVREQDDRFIYEFTNKITMRAMRKVLDEKRFGVANYLLESISAPPLTIATAILELIKEEG